MENKINVNDEIMNNTEKNIDNKSGERQNHASSSHGEHHSSHHHHHHSDEHRHGSGHHSSHHHHHGSSHHKSRKRRKKFKLNDKNRWWIIVGLLVVLIGVVTVFETMNATSGNDGQFDNGGITESTLNVELINSDGVLVKEAVRKYLLTDLMSSYYSDVVLSNFSNNEGRLDAQVPVSIKFSTKYGNAILYKIEIADNDKFNNARVSYFEGTSGKYSFEHLYTNTEYFYRVTVCTTDGVESSTGRFKTADTPRILSIEGLSNVRDIGNWKTDSGKRIKQGLLIRGTELDGAVESGYHLTNKGLSDLINIYGIKTDIDLRADTPLSMDALGSQVEHRYYGMVMYSNIFTDEGKEKIRAVFSDLANPENYPVYMHCTYGCDRTGTVCYLLEALLGVSNGDLLREYGLSNLNIEKIKSVETGLGQFAGETIKEQTESYLLSCGVTEYQIESIRNIFLGD